MIKNKSILVTGGAGFIGSHLFEKLMSEDNFVIIIDNFNNHYSGKEKNIAEITSSYKQDKDYDLIKGDLLDKEVYKKINNNIDLIFHIAALPGVRYSIQNTELVSKNNIIGTLNVFEYALQNKVSKVIFASSSSVYGNPIYTPVDENHPKNPISPYALSKLTCELYADYYFREYGLPITCLRFYTVYGQRGRPDMAIRDFINKIIHNQEISIYGDGEQLRDFTFVTDIVNGLILSGEKREADGQIFNLGNSNPISVNQLIEKLYSIAKKPKKIKYIEKQKGDVDVTYSNINKAKMILNYHPSVNIDEGLLKSYEWQISNSVRQ
jgi:nucleoside-diphosphate-sugar epimerase